MSWVEVDGAGWRWMELGGGGWSWVQVGARFSNTQKKPNYQEVLNLFFASHPREFQKENLLIDI